MTAASAPLTRVRGLLHVYRRQVPWLLLACLLLTGCAGAAPAPQAAAGPAGCPASVVVSPRERLPVPVPADPTAQTGGRLVPLDPPTAARVCRYGPVEGDAPPADVPLAAQAELTAGLDRLPDDLRLPTGGGGGSCTLALGRVTGYLLRLTYPDGVVWVSAAEEVNGCVDTANGPFRSGLDRSDLLAASLTAGAWTVPPLPDAAQRCVPERTGRAGQELALLPGEPASLVLCRVAGDGITRRTATPEQLAAVRDVLDEPVAVPSEGGCEGGGGEQYELVARYPSGPPVQVRYATGCRPDVDNGSLAATLSAADAARLRAVLAQGLG